MSDIPIEIQLASEETMRRNIRAVIDRYNRMKEEWDETKKIVRDLQGTVHMQNQRIQEMQNQISMLQARLYQGGTS